MSTPAALPVTTLLRERGRFLAFLEKRLGDVHAAEDVLQDAYLKVLAKARDLRDDEAVVAWFYQVLRNALVDHVRRRDVRSRKEGAGATGATRPSDPAPDLHDAVCACVGALLPSLRQDQADLLRRVELDGQRVKDVAADLALSPSATAVRLHRARGALASALRATCGACAQHGCLDCQCRARNGSALEET